MNETSGLAAAATRWQAALQLGFVRRQARTVLSHRQHAGPLLVQKALYPEGEAICHLLLLHPPGGIAGGDQLALQLTLAQHSQVLMSTPGASKWYKAHGHEASLQQHFKLADQAILEWLPQETLIYDQAEVNSETVIRLQGDAVYFGWEINVLGRQARGESFLSGRWRQQIQLWRDDCLLWHEAQHLAGGDLLLSSPLGLNHYPVFATLVLAAGTVPADLLSLCRAVATPTQSQVGLTTLPGLLIVRYLGHHAIQARQYFELLWQILRPWYSGRPAQALRIWRL